MSFPPAARVQPAHRPVARPRRGTRPAFDRLEDRLVLSSTPAISINDVTVTEGNSGSVAATFTVSLSKSSNKAVTVNYATANGTALAGSDYTATSGTLSFAKGQTSKTITVPVLGDTLDEPNETFSLKLSAPTNATIARGTGLGTILDNDPAPAIAVGDVAVSEAAGNALVTVSLSAPSGQTVTVAYATADGSAATAGGDYAPRSGTLSFAPGQTTQAVSVPVLNDANDEADETFLLNLSAPTNATIADAQGVVTIVDDDPSPTLSIDSPSVAEGDSGTRTLTFSVSLSAASGRPVTVGYATADGTAAAGTDYTAAGGSLSFAPGTTTQFVVVTIQGDTAVEADETLLVNLSGAVNASIASGQGTGTILNDDQAAAPPSISVGDATVVEGNSGSVNANFTVTLSAPSNQVVTVAYATFDGSAAAGSDYTATSGTLTFAPGATSQTVSVPVLGDTVFEPNEAFTLAIGNPVNATLGDSQGAGTIVNDDSAPTVTIDDASIVEGNSGTTNLVFHVHLSNPSSSIEWANVSTANGTATAPSDYTARTGGGVTFLAGVTEQTISIPIIGDTAVEADETFFVNVTSASRAIADGQAVGTIVNDDFAPGLRFAAGPGTSPTGTPGGPATFFPAAPPGADLIGGSGTSRRPRTRLGPSS